MAEGDMAEEATRDLIERYFQTVWIDGRWDRVYEFVSEGYVNHGSVPELPATSIEDGRRVDEAMRGVFPDIEFALDKVVAEEGMAARHWTAEATHKGEFMGFAPTGCRVHMEGMVFSRVENGRIIEEWRIVDSWGLLEQLRAAAQPGSIAD